MSDFGDVLFEQLPATSGLKDTNNPVRRILDNTMGEWFDQLEEEDWFNQFFLNTATGKYLDLHGGVYGVKRKPDESDSDYRERIIQITLGVLTIPYLKSVYNVRLYTYRDDFDTTDNTLVSDNPYLNHNGFLGVTDDSTKAILDKKFILENAVEWL